MYLHIYDLMGKLVRTDMHSALDKEIRIDVSNLQNGSYFIRTENSLAPFTVIR